MSMMTDESDQGLRPVPAKVQMTDAMRDGLDALQREYAAFVESSFKTLALISDQRAHGE